MNCTHARDWLLQADNVSNYDELTPESAARLQAHLETCAQCRILQQKLQFLEIHWRALPLVPSAEAVEASRDALLRRLPELARRPAGSILRPRFPQFSRRTVGWMAAAALLLVSVGLGALMMRTPSGTQAGDALVKRLLDWNLDLARTPAGPQRDHLANLAAAFQSEVQKAKLSAEESKLVQSLLASATDLARHSTAREQVENLSGVAGLLRDQRNKALQSGDRGKADKLSLQIQEVLDKGITPLLKDLSDSERDKVRNNMLDMQQPKDDHRH
jgi:hypothetical protein